MDVEDVANSVFRVDVLDSEHAGVSLRDFSTCGYRHVPHILREHHTEIADRHLVGLSTHVLKVGDDGGVLSLEVAPDFSTIVPHGLIN